MTPRSAKRMRVEPLPWEARGTLPNLEPLYPYSATPFLHFFENNGSGLGISSASLIPQYPPHRFHLAPTPLGAVFPVNEFGRASSRTLKPIDFVVRPHGETSDEKDRRIAALEQKVKNHQEFTHGAMEALERERAAKLKAQMTLEQFKKMVNMQQEFNNRLDSYSQIGDDEKTRSNLRRGPSFFLIEDSGSPRKLFPSNELEVVGGDNSSTSSLANKQMVRSKTQGRDSELVSRTGHWKDLLEVANHPAKLDKRTLLELDIKYQTSKLRALQLDRKSKSKGEKEHEVDKTLEDAFTPLSPEAESAIEEALGGSDRYAVLAMHEKSNIDVTRVVMQCLLPGAWLNDEVINVYMDLLKERELREPHRFLKCHFFNTFFYNKLYKDKRSYDYKAIRRWTTHKKLGYSLADCEKILVPIHQDIHWCLAVINIRDQKLEYLDSLKGGDSAVLEVLARYIADEAKDKDGRVLDVSTWEHDFPKDIPAQLNGCDCGMFMVKYADFHSRGAPLSFTQDNMEYFRRKMVWEILQLKAT